MDAYGDQYRDKVSMNGKHPKAGWDTQPKCSGQEISRFFREKYGFQEMAFGNTDLYFAPYSGFTLGTPVLPIHPHAGRKYYPL